MQVRANTPMTLETKLRKGYVKGIAATSSVRIPAEAPPNEAAIINDSKDQRNEAKVSINDCEGSRYHFCSVHPSADIGTALACPGSGAIELTRVSRGGRRRKQKSSPGLHHELSRYAATRGMSLVRKALPLACVATLRKQMESLLVELPHNSVSHWIKQFVRRPQLRQRQLLIAEVAERLYKPARLPVRYLGGSHFISREKGKTDMLVGTAKIIHKCGIFRDTTGRDRKMFVKLGCQVRPHAGRWELFSFDEDDEFDFLNVMVRGCATEKTEDHAGVADGGASKDFAEDGNLSASESSKRKTSSSLSPSTVARADDACGREKDRQQAETAGGHTKRVDRSGEHVVGCFLFPKSYLQHRGLLSKNHCGGSVSLTLYPPGSSAPAMRHTGTDVEQRQYYFDLSSVAVPSSATSTDAKLRRKDVSVDKTRDLVSSRLVALLSQTGKGQATSTPGMEQSGNEIDSLPQQMQREVNR
ncbi:unnamed protein product [Amoebophrya sp. A25]|nr:unnamed protein product [Amoebophrya sp. A25]|eukprot:GSA25T00010210001.1